MVAHHLLEDLVSHLEADSLEEHHLQDFQDAVLAVRRLEGPLLASVVHHLGLGDPREDHPPDSNLLLVSRADHLDKEEVMDHLDLDVERWLWLSKILIGITKLCVTVTSSYLTAFCMMNHRNRNSARY